MRLKLRVRVDGIFGTVDVDEYDIDRNYIVDVLETYQGVLMVEEAPMMRVETPLYNGRVYLSLTVNYIDGGRLHEVKEWILGFVEDPIEDL